MFIIQRQTSDQTNAKRQKRSMHKHYLHFDTIHQDDLQLGILPQHNIPVGHALYLATH